MSKSGTARDTDKVRKLVTGYQVARALLAADEIGLLDQLQDGSKNVSELAKATGTHLPTMSRFIRALAAVELLVIDGRDRVFQGPLAEGLRDAARIGIENYRAWCELPYTLRTGKPAFDQVFGKGLYEYLDGEPEKAERFNAALAAVSKAWIPGVLSSVDFSGDKTVADIGGGHGTFLVEVLKKHSHLKGILVDQAPVLDHADSLLTAEGVKDRCRLEPADFLESLPEGADVSTLCNLLTDWDDEYGSLILQNCRASMGNEGRVIVIDRILPPPEDPTHGSTAFLDLFFLVMEGGCIRTHEEFVRLFENAGLRFIRSAPVGGGFHALEAR